MAESSKWDDFRNIVKNYFGWWVDISQIEPEDSTSEKVKKISIKVLGVLSLVVFSPIYILGLILAFIIAL